MTKTFLNLATMAIGVLSGLPTLAEEAGQPNAPHEVEAYHRNKIEFGIANTHTKHGDNAITLAVSYGYRFSELASIGILGEYAFGDLDFGIVGIPLKLYPGDGWVLVAMPGVEIHDGHQEVLFRLGVGYEFEMEGFSITPEVAVDYVDDEVDLVVGLTFGFGF
jgi:hypothetical protein